MDGRIDGCLTPDAYPLGAAFNRFLKEWAESQTAAFSVVQPQPEKE